MDPLREKPIAQCYKTLKSTRFVEVVKKIRGHENELQGWVTRRQQKKDLWEKDLSGGP